MLLALTIIAAPVVRQYASEEGRTAIAEAIASALGNDDLDDEDEDDEYDDLGNLISSAASGSMAIFEDVVIDEDEEEARDSEEEMGAAGGYADGQSQGIQSIISGPDAEESVDVGDMINDLFDEDDEDKERLEALAKQLEDVDLDGLLKQAREMADELTKMVDWESRRAA